MRVNHRIRATEVRVIADDGAQVGVMSTGSALKLASERGLDLVEIAPEARPPVCRIVDFGKFRYEQAKKHKGDLHHVHATKLKELKFHVNIGQNDYDIKLRHAAGFLQKGMRVKVSLYFRGREMQHQEFGLQLIQRVIQDMTPYAHTDTAPRLLGKNLHVILVPGKAKPKSPSGEVVPATPNAAVAVAEPPKPFGATIKIDLKPAAQEPN
ncbi:MAG: translation initiation factor IF-3 [Verrucomicrobia bacterium]|nr:translation initiation factor IF-3 [Verrucomicrobiota bacterium]